ncbi:MAG: DUF1440 domain-containing protein [Acetobacteraceae bacterium]|nr:DUF1440 domain-containing protein [Acetobacteraceae bacterium]
MGRYTTGGVGRDVLAGAIAGGAAVWLINKMDWSLTHSGRAGPASPSNPEPAHAAAAKAAGAAGVQVTDQQRKAMGHTVHYGIGVGIGALYGLLRGMAPSVTTGRGALYGVATFILGDEVGAPALGLSKGPFDYPARDHAKSALAHVVFGLLTDLGTRLLAPWEDEVVILRGPSLHERLEGGRQAIADSRDYLYDQGRHVLDRGRAYAEQARERLEELELGERARQYAGDLRSRLPDSDDVADTLNEGRRRARRFAGSVADYAPERDDVADAVEKGRSRARGWARAARNQLPDRDDVDDAVEQGRKRGRKLAKRARERLPERDDMDDAVQAGRNRVRQLASDAQDAGESGINRLTRWLFG